MKSIPIAIGLALAALAAAPSRADNASQVAAGEIHSCALTTAGGVKCWGRNIDGQLGDGTQMGRAVPVDVVGLASGVLAIAVGDDHSCALTTGGGMKCWGQNDLGQLGDGSQTNSLTPVDVSGLTSGVAAIAAGGYHTCALTTAGGVKCWGMNLYGQVGNGSQTTRTTPADVTGLTSGVIALGPGRFHSCAITSAGAAKCWGRNNAGQLGNNEVIAQRLTPVDVSGLATGTAAIEGGAAHACALTTGGAAKCWGYNATGQLGDNTLVDKLVPTDVLGQGSGMAAVMASYDSSCSVTAGGALTCWGGNAFGQLGDNSTTNRSVPTAVFGLGSGVAQVAGAGSTGNHACARTTGGALKCWGTNAYGELGDGSTTQRLTPVDVSGMSDGLSAGGQSIAFTPTATGSVGTAITVSATASSGLAVSFDGWTPGTCTVSGNTVTPVAVGLCGVRASQAGNGSFFAAPRQLRLIAIAMGNQAISFASLSGRTLGDAPFTVSASGGGSGYPVTFTSTTLPVCSTSGTNGTTVTLLAAGTCTIAANQAGDANWNPAPQVTRSFNVAKATPVVGLATSGSPSTAGQSVTFTASVSGSVGVPSGTVAFRDGGVDISGCAAVALSAGSAQCATAALTTASHSITAVYSGDAAYAATTSAPITQVVQLPTFALSVSIAGNGGGTVLSSVAGIDCPADCGENYVSGTVVTLLAQALPHSRFSGWSGSACAGLGSCVVTMAAARSVTATFTRHAQSSRIDAGEAHTIALRGDGTLWAWGYNYYGQLGNGSNASSALPAQVGALTGWIAVAAGDNHSLALRVDGTLWAWGRNDFGQLGDGTITHRNAPVQVGTATDWVAVSAGGNHTAALRSNGSLWTWGANLYGQLGDGTTVQSNTPVMVAGNWSSVSAGGGHTVAVNADGTLWGWGRNHFGQVGDGTILTRLTPVQVGTATDWEVVAAGDLHTLGVRINGVFANQWGGSLWSWGWNAFGQRGDGTTAGSASPAQVGSATDWTMIAPGAAHTVATRFDGTLWAWGLNDYGQLGNGSMANALTPAPIGSATDWFAVAAGGSHSAGSRLDGTFWTWGRNDSGQVGDGSAVTRTSPVQIVLSSGVPMRRSDANGDGRSDVVWRDTSGGLVYQWQMNGLAISGQGYMPSVPPAWSIAGIGDLSGDGKADVVWREPTAGLNYVWILDGIAVTGGGYLPTVPAPWAVVGVGDTNGDAKADLFWRNPTTGDNYLWMMNALAITGQGYLPNVPAAWKVVAVADYTGDGKADVLWRNEATGDNYLWVMNGLTIANQGYLANVTGSDWEVVGAPDADGDSRADVLWRNNVTGQNYLWLMNGLALSGQGYLPTVADLNWKVAGFGDYNGDGRGDVLWRHVTSGQNYLWTMNALTVETQGYLPSVAGSNWQPVK